MTKKYLYLIAFLTVNVTISESCTVFSAKDKYSNVWAGDNEDKPFTLSTCLNIVAPADKSFGYFYFTNSNNPNEFPQGGMNDAGLFYGANTVPPSKYKDYDNKKDFPGGINQMMLFVLKKCKTVKEVFAVFKIYRMPGIEGSQLHFADKYGNKGIIVADSMWLAQEDFQISTNYNLCHPDKDSIQCWRYPIAERMIKSREIGYETFRDICDSTSQKKWTNFSSIQNLGTGDIWIFFGQNYNRPYNINIKELLKQGTRSFYLYELFKDDILVKQIIKSKEAENRYALIVLISILVILFAMLYIFLIRRRLRKLKNS